MQGVVTDEKGTKVKAAIVVLLKVKNPDDESDTEIATYAETDEEGRFMIQDINPEDKYFIEIHVDHSEFSAKLDRPKEEAADEAEPVVEVDETETPVVEQESTEEPNPENAADEIEVYFDEFEEEFNDELDNELDDELDEELDEDLDDELDDEKDDEMDSLNRSRTDETKIKNICVNNLYYISDTDMIYKLYHSKKHFW